MLRNTFEPFMDHFRRNSSNHIITIGVIVFTLGYCFKASAETLSLTTYYPSPIGAYSELLLVPQAAKSGACTPGTFYVRNDNYQIEVCGSTSSWTGSTLSSAWTQSGTDLYPNNTAWNVAIGTVTPGAKLDVNGSANIRSNALVTGNVGIGSTNPATKLDVNGTSTLRGDTIITTGNVGIGSTNPATKLDVNGQISIRGGAPASGKVLTSDGSGTASWNFITYGP